MFCSQCGHSLFDGSGFCPECGTAAIASGDGQKPSNVQEDVKADEPAKKQPIQKSPSATQSIKLSGQKKLTITGKPVKPNPVKVSYSLKKQNQKIFCQECGEELAPHEKFCPKCGKQVVKADAPKFTTSKYVDNHQVLALFSLFLCVPAGIIALILAGSVTRSLDANDIEAAKHKAVVVKVISLIGIAIGLIVIIIWSSLWLIAPKIQNYMV